jgi:hypothetical protein
MPFDVRGSTFDVRRSSVPLSGLGLHESPGRFAFPAPADPRAIRAGAEPASGVFHLLHLLHLLHL